MSKAIAKVARSGYDVRTADDVDLAFTSERVSPKIFMTKVHTKPVSSPYNTTYSHDLGFTPSWFSFREVTSGKWSHGNIAWTSDYDPFTGGDNTLVTADTEDFNINIGKYDGSYDLKTSVIGIIDPLSSETFDKDIPSGPAFILTNGGNIKNTNPNTHSIDTRFNTFKVFRSGTLTLNLSSATLASGADDTESTSYQHGLGYVPFFTPFVPYTTRLEFAYFGSTIPTTINVNNFEDLQIPWGTGADTIEEVRVYMTDDKLYLEVYRENVSLVSQTMPSRTINLNYTIFYNPIDEDFNLLND